jgi:hypothetical protein
MTEKFYVRLTLFFLDGTISVTIADIWEAVALERELESAPQGKKPTSLIDLDYTTLKELPDDDQTNS